MSETPDMLSGAESSAYRRWQSAVAAYRRAEEALRAAKAEADSAVVELAKFAVEQKP